MQRRTWLSRHLARSWRGTLSAVAGLAFPLGGRWLGGPRRLSHPERLAHGLAIVLPGIEGAARSTATSAAASRTAASPAPSSAGTGPPDSGR